MQFNLMSVRAEPLPIDYIVMQFKSCTIEGLDCKVIRYQSTADAVTGFLIGRCRLPSRGQDVFTVSMRGRSANRNVKI